MKTGITLVDASCSPKINPSKIIRFKSTTQPKSPISRYQTDKQDKATIALYDCFMSLANKAKNKVTKRGRTMSEVPQINTLDDPDHDANNSACRLLATKDTEPIKFSEVVKCVLPKSSFRIRRNSQSPQPHVTVKQEPPAITNFTTLEHETSLHDLLPPAGVCIDDCSSRPKIDKIIQILKQPLSNVELSPKSKKHAELVRGALNQTLASPKKSSTKPFVVKSTSQEKNQTSQFKKELARIQETSEASPETQPRQPLQNKSQNKLSQKRESISNEMNKTKASNSPSVHCRSSMEVPMVEAALGAKVVEGLKKRVKQLRFT